MTEELPERLLQLVAPLMSRHDSAHDLNHARRVAGLASRIAMIEGADAEIVIAAAILHDVVIYPKNDERSSAAPDESARLAVQLLRKLRHFPTDKIPAVAEAIRSCSFSGGRFISSVEAAVVHDADLLEATGAIAIMRTFASTGQMGRPLYDEVDPLRRSTEADDRRSGLDLSYVRLLRVPERLHTAGARALAASRHVVLQDFLVALERELREDGVLSD